MRVVIWGREGRHLKSSCCLDWLPPVVTVPNAYPLCCKWPPSLLQMTTLYPSNGYPLSCKCLPSRLQMGTLSPANDYPLSCKWLPSLLLFKCLPPLLQMGTLSPANDYPLCCFSKVYPLCCKWVLSLQNITFRVVLWHSMANLLCVDSMLHVISILSQLQDHSLTSRIHFLVGIWPISHQ